MNNKIFSKIKAKYPLAALAILIIATLMGKPILGDSSSEVPVAEATVTEAVVTEPAVAETVTTEPTITEPAVTETVATEPAVTETTDTTVTETATYTFRSEDQYISHYEKHGIEMGFASAEEYLAAANKVISSPDALHKLEAEDNDHIYYMEETNEFVVLSQDGYIRTYFLPNAGIDYFNRQ